MTKEEIVSNDLRNALKNKFFSCGIYAHSIESAANLIESQAKRIGELERDKQRLDWLHRAIFKQYTAAALREAIDAAINQAKDDNTRTIS